MDSADWDERYAKAELVWGAPPNAVVVEQVTGLGPGAAIDLACGEGRNSIWLALWGWQVRAVDFSRVALDKGATIASRSPRAVRERIEWVAGDLTTADFGSGYDLVLFVYLHLPAEQRRSVLTRSVEALNPGGTLLVLGHDRTNITEGVGGPQDPEILYTPDDVVRELGDSPQVDAVHVTVAERRFRTTDAGVAIDALVVATKPG